MLLSVGLCFASLSVAGGGYKGRGCCLMADKQLKYISFLCSFLEDPMVTCLIYSNSLLHLKEVNIVSTVKWDD